jgi:hypothetical protein
LTRARIFAQIAAVKTNPHPRKRIAFSHVRWTSYALAAGATTVGTLVTTEAEIHYSGPIDYVFRGNSTFKTHTFPLSNGARLTGALNKVRFLNYDYAYFGVKAAISNSVRGPGQASGFFRVASLPGKSIVSAGSFFPTNFGFATMQDGNCHSPYWQEPGTYYVGFRFNSGAGTQYGWARIRWTGCPTNFFKVKDYAWGDPGDQIKTGQRRLKDSAAPVETSGNTDAPLAPAEGSIGLLALGAVGLLAWRKSRRVE